MSSLLSMKDAKFDPDLVKSRNLKFFRDRMEGYRIKKFRHKTERKSLNMSMTISLLY